MKIFSLILFFFLSWNGSAQESADSFVVDISDYSVRVVSPGEKKPKASIIIKNETLSSIYLKIVGDGQDITYTHLLSQKSFSKEVDFSPYKQVSIIPLSPPSMTVDLKFSEKAYEIPASKE